MLTSSRKNGRKADRESLVKFTGESFHSHSERTIEVEGMDSGVLILSVSTIWPGNSDRSMIALLPDELAAINMSVNG